MKQRFTLLLLTLLTISVAFANPIGLEQARSKAAKFLKEFNNGATLASEEPEYAPARSIRGVQTAEKTPAYYVFNAENECGYVIVSGDDKTDEILAYSTTGTFDLESMPANVKAWLQGYAEQIAMLEGYVVQEHAATTSSTSWKAIAPLITTKWDQGSPYNGQCPLHYGYNSVTGCTATAMAQVMNYHEWPEGYCESIPAYTTETYKLSVSALGTKKFQWNQMQDTYTSDDSGDAVAWLMRYCGQAIKSDYSWMSTGAFTQDVASSMVQYFNYDQNLEMKYLDNYGISEWEEIIYNELKANRPVFHSGYSLGGGHAFVCDGYDGNGMFHFNWGWSGSYDGYYKLALMTPGTEGTGSGSSDGYSYGQQIIVGIQPPTGEPAKPKYLDIYYQTIQSNGTTMESAFANFNSTSFSGGIGFATVDENNNILRVLKSGNLTLNSGYYATMTLDIEADNISLANGTTHRIATICKPSGETEWKRIGGKQNFYNVTISNVGIITSVTQSPVIKASYGWACTGNLVAGVQQNVMVRFINEGDDLNTVVYLFASPTTTMGDPQSRTAVLLKKGETIDYTLTFTPETAGTYNLWLAQDYEGTAVLAKKTVTIKAAPTLPSDLTLVSYDVDETEVSAKVIIKNNSTEGYYREIVAMLYENLYNDGYVYLTETISLPGDIAAGATKTFNFDFHTAQSYTGCGIKIGYAANHTDQGYTQLGEWIWFTTGDTPVESIMATPAEQEGPMYRLDGTKVASPSHKGIYISNGKKLIAK